MEAKERMKQLLLQVNEADEDDLTNEWISLEPVLSITELFLLLKVAAQDGEWLFEPIWTKLKAGADGEPEPIAAAPFLEETQLLMLARQARLETLGLLRKELKEAGWEFVLTPKGAHAVDWWLGCLLDVGLKHETIEAGMSWQLREQSTSQQAEAFNAAFGPETPSP